MSSLWDFITGGDDYGLDLGSFGDVAGNALTGDALSGGLLLNSAGDLAGAGMWDLGLGDWADAAGDSIWGSSLGSWGSGLASLAGAGDSAAGYGNVASYLPGAGTGTALLDMPAAYSDTGYDPLSIGTNLDRLDWLSGYDQPSLDSGMTVNEASARAGYGNSSGFSNAMAAKPAGSYDPNRSFSDRLTSAISNPNTWLKAGLALASGSGGGPTNTKAALSNFNAQDAAARAENAGLRTQINTDARNLQESGGANQFRSAQVRGANEVDALKRQLGYTASPTFVKDALVNKAQQRAGLNAQTAAVQGDVAARNAAAGLYKMAPEPNATGLSYAASLDSANALAKKNQNAGIGSAVESIFGYKQDEDYLKSKRE